MISHKNPIRAGAAMAVRRRRTGQRGLAGLVARRMPLFLGTFVNKVDKKGRVSVPATFRARLAAQSFPGVVAYPSFTGPAIEGCGMDHMESLMQGTDRLDVFSEEQDEMTTLIFAGVRELPWDGDGRIVLPEEFIAHAGLAGAAAFVGKGRTFQIWEPERQRAHMEEVRRRAMQKRLTLPAPLKPEDRA